MNLFSELNRVMTTDSVVTITIKKKSDTKLIVLSDLTTAGLTDPAANNIPPLKVSGSPAELDTEWLQTILSPVQSAIGLQTNMKEFEEGLKKAEEKRKAEDGKKKAEADEKDKALDKLINDGRDAFKKKDWKTAVSKWEEAMKMSKDLKKEFKTNCLKKDLETAKKNAAAAPTLLNFDSFEEDEKHEEDEKQTKETNETQESAEEPAEQEKESLSEDEPQEDSEEQNEEAADETAEEEPQESHSFDEFDDM